MGSYDAHRWVPRAHVIPPGLDGYPKDGKAPKKDDARPTALDLELEVVVNGEKVTRKVKGNSEMITEEYGDELRAQ